MIASNPLTGVEGIILSKKILDNCYSLVYIRTRIILIFISPGHPWKFIYKEDNAMRSITTLDLQYAHRFYGFKGEAQYLHGHTGVLTICNEIQKTAWEVLKNFDHALILREDDPLLPAVLQVYEDQGIRNGTPQNQMKGPAFQTELAKAYPECRLVVTKETLTVEGMIKIVYDLLKDKLNIAKITFTSGVNAASAEFVTKNQIDRCPLCGIALNEKGVCPKCGYQKK